MKLFKYLTRLIEVAERNERGAVLTIALICAINFNAVDLAALLL